MRGLVVGAALVALAGCEAAEPLPVREPEPVPAYDPANPGPWCLGAASALGNPYADPALEAILIETMRNRGCMS